MGQAKRRGTFEERVTQVQLAEAVIAKAFPNVPNQAADILWRRFHGDKIAFANAILSKQNNDFYRGWPIIANLMDPQKYRSVRGNIASAWFKTVAELKSWIDLQEHDCTGVGK